MGPQRSASLSIWGVLLSVGVAGGEIALQVPCEPGSTNLKVEFHADLAGLKQSSYCAHAQNRFADCNLRLRGGRGLPLVKNPPYPSKNIGAAFLHLLFSWHPLLVRTCSLT